MEHAKEKLSQYLDGALAEGERGAVEEHLAACADCKAELEALRSVSRLVGELPKAPLPAGFMERLNRRLARGEAKPSWAFSGPYAWHAATAFAAAGVVVMAVAYHQSRLRLETAGFPAAGQLESIKGADAASSPIEEKSYWRRDIRAKGEPVSAAAAGPAAPAGALVAPPIPAPTKIEGSNEAIHSFLEKERDRMGIRDIVARQQPVRAAGPDTGEGESAQGPMDKSEAMAYVRQMTAQLASINRARESRNPPAVAVVGAGKPRMLETSEASHPLGAAGAVRGASMEAGQAAASIDSLSMLRAQSVPKGRPLPEPAEASLDVAPRAVAVKKASAAPRIQEPAVDFRWNKSWAGAASGLVTGNSVIRDRAHWEALWARLGLEARAPEVDFNKQMVVAILGKEASGVEIVSVRPQGPTLWISYRPIAPKKEYAGKTPYHIVAVARSGLDVAFEEIK